MGSTNVQIPKRFLLDAYMLMLMLDDVELDDDIKELCKSIENQAKTKLDAIKKRDAFTSYKTAGTPVEREQYRNEYLDRAGIQPDFRSNKEINFKQE